MSTLTKARFGMDINVSFSIMRVDVPEDLTKVKDIKITITHINYDSVHAVDAYEIINGNTLEIRIKGGKPYECGSYRLEVSYTLHNTETERDEPFVIDVMAFEIVPFSDMVNHGVDGCPNLAVTQVKLLGVIDISKGGSGGGVNGVTFTPSVKKNDNTVTISWTNNGGLPNPKPVVITIPKGEDGTPKEVIDNLTSTLMDGALSANQGRVLNESKADKMQNTISSETDITLKVEANKSYEFGELTTLILAFTKPNTAIHNKIIVSFISGVTPTTLTLPPESTTIESGFTVVANKYYELNFAYIRGKWNMLYSAMEA